MAAPAVRAPRPPAPSAADSPDMMFLENKSRETFGQQGQPKDVITNAFKCIPPKKRAQLQFFDCNIVLQGAREGQKIRKDQNRRVMVEVLDQMADRFQWPRKPLFAYDDEKTFVLVNCTPKLPMALHDKQDFAVVGDGPRQADGARVVMHYDIALTYTKELLITAADFQVMDRQHQTNQQVSAVIERQQALNLLLREAMTDASHAEKNPDRPNQIIVSMGDKIYSNLTEQRFPRDIGRYRAIWPGFTASFKITCAGLILNADLTHSVFFNEGKLHEIVCSMMELGTPTPASRIDSRLALKKGLGAILRTRLVEFQTSDGETCLLPGPLGQLGKMFYRSAVQQFVADGVETTVAEAYAAHNIPIEFPELGCVEVHYGSATYRVPLEKCYLTPGQRYNALLSKQDQAVFIRAVSLSPDKRIGEIAQFMDISRVRSHPLMLETGLTIEDHFIEIGGRVLPLPAIEYRPRRENSPPVVVTPINGQWTMARGVQYQKSAVMPAYLVLVFPIGRSSGCPCMAQNRVVQFLQQMAQEAVSRGMTWGNLINIYNIEQPPERMVAEITECVQHFNPKFVFGIFDRGTDRMYSDWKAVMDNHLGIPSQGLLNQTIDRNPRGCIDNILFKVNIKCGGNNNTLTENGLDNLKMLHRYFMVIGISLSHGQTKDEDCKPSYAGFVGSTDDTFRSWVSEVMVTEANDAVLPQITEKIKNLLHAYRASCGRFPELLIVYRDGVTRTQEGELNRNDLRCIREAFRQLNAQIELVFVVVNKMHRTRFFQKPTKNAMGAPVYSRDNIPPGLIVDDQIVDPYGDDFYLASHRGLLGTSRPIRYNILVNEDSKQTDADDVQGLTMALCYIYQRCTLGVSIPAPLYYANLAAARCAVLADSVIRHTAASNPGRGQGGARGGRGGGRGRGAPAAPVMADPVMRQAITQGIVQHPFLKENQRLSFI
ncbi:putative Protein argonaute-2 [Hypsibius exemplaris]|uniref:Piwi domain-containing protein n=1 Tax=Hypsibius exemplaris TaxID=2072580 RepID=A0A1W0XCS0_HYPEX|nr:putative Protein argonaute-2 [Hypsibius exemplaris]